VHERTVETEEEYPWMLARHSWPTATPRGAATIIVRLADAKIVAWSMYPAGLLTNIPPKRNVE